MLEVIKLFVRRMFMGKGKGILQIPPQNKVDDFANDLFKKFKQNGVPDEAVTNPNDVKAIWNQITNREAQILSTNLKDVLQKPDPFKKAGEVFDLKGKKIKNPQKIMGGEELPGETNIFSNKYVNDLDKKIIDSDAFGYSQKEWNNLSNSSKEKFRRQFDSNYEDAMENTQMATLKEVETEAQILARLNKGNKESLSNMRYEKAVKAEEAKAAADEDYIMKIFDPEDFAQGGRAGLYRGGQAMIEPDLSDIGHGSDALMARNALLTPGSQATTSTGLNYLLGEDNDTTRVPYKHGDMVLPKEKPMDEYMLKKLMSQAGAETLDARTRDMFIQMYKKKIREKNSKADGGPARQNFGMGRRAFLKLFGSGVAGVGAAKSGLFGLLKGGAGKKVATEVVKDVAGSGTPPPYFFKLVEKIKTLGDDAPKLAVKDREKITTYKDYTLTEDVTTGEKTIQRMKIDDDLKYDASEYYGRPVGEDVYMNYKPGKSQIDETTKGKTPPDEYTEDTSLIRSDKPAEGEVMDTFDGVPDDILKEVGETIVKKADGGRIGYKLGKKVVETVIKKAGEGKFTKNQVLEGMFKNTIKETKDVNTKTRFLNFIEEIKAKPELSKDPEVWNFFTKGLPKNQKLIVYGDDTVDFWKLSDFGPHNIATSAKFQKKHPYLTKEQAIKIQRMEPEDQIFEMKRLEAIRKRTANASGGIAAMLGE